jgi:acyl-CoA synthetase (AMP-forming)/AMP-acid ligase II
VLFLPEFPLTATGKVQRFRLREHALAQIAAGRRARAGRRSAAGSPAREAEPA